LDGVKVGPATNVTSAGKMPTQPPPFKQPEYLKQFPDMPDHIRNVVQPDFTQTPQFEYRRRSKAVAALVGQLAPEDVKVLYAFLRMPPEEDRSMEPLALNSVKNDLMDLLIRQDPLPPDLGRQLLAIIGDLGADEVLRDYAIQHLAPYFDRRWPSGSPPDSERDAVMEACRRELDTADGTFAGTALIALHRIATTHPDIGRDGLLEKTRAMASDGSRSAITRTTAIQLCGRVGDSGILPVARVEAQSAETVQFRMAAIATLGDVGTSEDRNLLVSLAAENEARIRTAALSALKRLTNRLERVEPR